MNPRAVHVALVVSGVAATIYIAAIVFFALTSCAASMPPEPPYVETVSATTRDR